MFFNIFLFCLKGRSETLRKDTKKTLKSDKNKNILWIEIKEHSTLVYFL